MQRIIDDFDPAQPSGPIPGENYTSDERNYPWHRPPEYTDMDSALERVIADFEDDPDTYQKHMSFIEVGLPVTLITEILVMRGVSKGYWTVDFGILLAGPIAKILTIFAKSFGIEFNLGIDRTPNFPTATELREAMQQPDAVDQAMEEAREEIEVASDKALQDVGLAAPVSNTSDVSTGAPMLPASPEEQESMLGGIEEVPEQVDQVEQ